MSRRNRGVVRKDTFVVRYSFREHYRELETIAEQIMHSYEILEYFKPQVMFGVMWIAMYDADVLSVGNDEAEADHWEELSTILDDEIASELVHSTEFECDEESEEFDDYEIDENDKSVASLIRRIAMHTVESDKVILIDPEVPEEITYNTRHELSEVATSYAESIAESIAAYDLSSDEDYLEIASGLRDFSEGSKHDYFQAINTSISLPQRRVIFQFEMDHARTLQITTSRSRKGR